MAGTLQIVWEDNPDTPLKASNISKIIQSYKEDDMLFIDAHDSKLKLRANSKVSMKIKNTSAFFDFNKSFVTHDSNDYFYPVQTENLSFRIESPTQSELYSLAIESNTQNMLTNSNFSSSLTNWAIDLGDVGFGSGSSDISVEASGEDLFGNCAKITTDEVPHIVSMSQNKTIDYSTISTFSVSFYYNSDKDLKFKLVGKNSSDSSNLWWRDKTFSETKWIIQEFDFQLVSTSGSWVRYELKNIPTITGTGANIDKVELLFVADSRSTAAKISNVQLEANSYCSSYTASSRNDAIFSLRKDSIRMSQGVLDFEVCVNSFNSDRNYIMHVETADRPAMKLYFDQVNPLAPKLVFSVLNLSSTLPETGIGQDAAEVNYVKCEYLFDTDTFKSLVGKWIRILVSWDFTLSTREMRLYINNGTTVSKFEFIPSATNFTVCTDALVVRLSIGGIYTLSTSKMLLEGIIKNLKLNLFSKSSQKIIYDLARAVYPEENNYKLYEVENKNIVINDISTLDHSLSYYIWLVLDENNFQDALIVLSTSNASPYTNYHHFSKLIGSFNTDSDSSIATNTLKDETMIGSQYVKLKIESAIPTDVGKDGEIRILNTSGVKRVIMYLNNEWI